MMDAVTSNSGASETTTGPFDRPQVTAQEAVEKMVQAGMLDDLKRPGFCAAFILAAPRG